MRAGGHVKKLAALAFACALSACETPAPPHSVEARQAALDADINLTTGTLVVNTYTALTANAAAGATQLQVASTTGFNDGDLVMVIQMQGATITNADDRTYGSVTSYNSAGRYELVRVNGAPPSATRLNVTNACSGLQFSYSAAGKAQVIRVKEVNNVTVASGAAIVAPAWNGSTGGVIAIRAINSATVNGEIRANAVGFRGGAVEQNARLPGTYLFRSTDSQDGAEKGESIAGYQADYDALGGRYGRGAPANGGGGGNAHNAGGGGGANAWPSTKKTWTGQGVMNGAPSGWETAWALDPAYQLNGNALTDSSGGGRGGYAFGSSNQNALTVAPGDSRWGGDFRAERGGMGGRPLDANPTNRVFLGGGGGAGDSNNNGGNRGGAGGGIVMLLAGSVAGSGTIAAAA
jgi:hypothetical protein